MDKWKGIGSIVILKCKGGQNDHPCAIYIEYHLTILYIFGVNTYRRSPTADYTLYSRILILGR